MLYLDSLACVSGSNFVAGVTEYEEGYEDKRREKHGYNRKALSVGHLVAGSLYPLTDFPFWPVPHLII